MCRKKTFTAIVDASEYQSLLIGEKKEFIKFQYFKKRIFGFG